MNDQNAAMVLQEGIVNSGYYSMILILYWLLFNFMTFYILKVVDNLIDKISGQQKILEDSNKEMRMLLSTLEATNKALEVKLFQHKSEVEDVVYSYAHFNSHSIRGPYCRLKGILMLNEISALEEEDYKQNLQQTMRDLEAAINRMQEEMNDKIHQLSIFEEKQMDFED